MVNYFPTPFRTFISSEFAHTHSLWPCAEVEVLGVDLSKQAPLPRDNQGRLIPSIRPSFGGPLLIRVIGTANEQSVHPRFLMIDEDTELELRQLVNITRVQAETSLQAAVPTAVEPNKQTLAHA